MRPYHKGVDIDAGVAAQTDIHNPFGLFYFREIHKTSFPFLLTKVINLFDRSLCNFFQALIDHKIRNLAKNFPTYYSLASRFA